MRTITALLTGAATLILAGCSPKSEYRNFGTPEGAVRTLLEAASIGDNSTSLEAVVSRERVTFETSAKPVFYYHENGEIVYGWDFVVGQAEHIMEKRAQVPVTIKGNLTLTFPCEMETDGWRVSAMGLLEGMFEGFEEELQKLQDAVETMPAPR